MNGRNRFADVCRSEASSEDKSRRQLFMTIQKAGTHRLACPTVFVGTPRIGKCRIERSRQAVVLLYLFCKTGSLRSYAEGSNHGSCRTQLLKLLDIVGLFVSMKLDCRESDLLNKLCDVCNGSIHKDSYKFHSTLDLVGNESGCLGGDISFGFRVEVETNRVCLCGNNSCGVIAVCDSADLNPHESETRIERELGEPHSTKVELKYFESVPEISDIVPRKSNTETIRS